MSKALFLQDSYLKESDAEVVSVKDGKYVVLDQTIFYPKGGGQPWDTGKMIYGSDVYDVIYVGKFGGKISHELDKPGLRSGEKVHCVLNWERRYRLMRNHTAAHTLAAILVKKTGALITGNQLEEDKVRFDFSLEDFDREIFKGYVDKANELFKRDVPVKWYELPVEEAMKIPGVVKLAKALPPNIPVLRIVEIVGVDRQADAGTHVRNLKEVGAIEMINAKNKGKNNRRIYFKLTS